MQAWEAVHGALSEVAGDALAAVEGVGHDVRATAQAGNDVLALLLVLLIGLVTRLGTVQRHRQRHLRDHITRELRTEASSWCEWGAGRQQCPPACSAAVLIDASMSHTVLYSAVHKPCKAPIVGTAQAAVET